MEIQENLNILFWRAEYYGAYTNLGVASLYMGLVDAALKYKWNVTFASSGKMDLPKEADYRFIEHNRLLRNLPEVLNLPYNFKSARKVQNIIQEKNVDLVFQHNHDFNFGASLIKSRNGIPTFIHCDGVEYWIKKNWGKLYLGSLLKWAEEIQWNSADRIFVVSKKIQEQLSKHGVDEKKIIVSPNGVDTDFFKPTKKNESLQKKLNIKAGDFVCAFAGSFGHWHGVDTIASSLKFLKGQIPNIKFLIIGDGDLRPQLDEIIKRDKVEDNVVFTGVIDYRLIPTYLNLADILMTPCKSNDDDSGFFNSPIKLFEYMALEKPIVATSVGQQSEVLDNGKLGELIPERQPEKLAESIFKIYLDYEFYREVAKNARIKCLTTYDWRNNIQRIYKAYQEVKSQ